MRFFDYLFAAFKNFSRQKLRTSLTIAAITVGSLSVILMFSIIISVRQSLMDAFKEMGAFTLVTVIRDPNSATDNVQLITGAENGPGEEGKKIDDTTVKNVRTISHVVDVTPAASVWVKTIRLEGQDKKMWSNLMAYDPRSNVFDLPLLAGRNLKYGDMDKIVVGSRFIETYNYSANPQELIGKKVIMHYEGGGNTPDWGDPPPRPPKDAGEAWWEEQQKKKIEITAEIIGVANNETMDDMQNYITIDWGRRLSTQLFWKFDEEAKKKCEEGRQGWDNMQKGKDNCENGDCQYSSSNRSACDEDEMIKLTKDDYIAKNGYGSLIIKTDLENNVKQVAKEVEAMGYGAITAERMIEQINDIFLGISIVLGSIGGISLFVAAIGIINTMVMATYERIREIGVMRACGATRSVIWGLFTFEAAMLGFCGGALGIVVSFFSHANSQVCHKKI